MNVVAFRAEHLAQIGEQDAQAWAMQHITPMHAQALEGELSFSALAGETVLMCAGVVLVWQGRYLAWAYLGSDAKRHFKSIHKATKKFFDELDAPRVEANIDLEFKAAAKWARRLGFEMEAPLMRNFLPNGNSAALYARVKV